MNRKTFRSSWIIATMLLFGLSLFAACGLEPPGSELTPQPGQTSFTTSEEDGSNNTRSYGDGAPTSEGANASAGNSDSSKQSAPAPAAPGAPSGREGTVEEADLYKVSGNLLFYLNTYKGLTVFDVKDRKNPRKIAGLPVFGYPIEMFIEKNVVYALVRDALYLMKVNGKFEFHRHNVSQMVAIDISRPSQPRVLQRIDIQGQLREGVSRKIDDTIYVVSYTPKYYWSGWSYNRQTKDEQATVYSFNVSNPRQMQKVQTLDLIKDRPKSTQSNTVSESYSFSGVTISATANSLLVGENWSHYRYNRSSNGRCSQNENGTYTKLSVVDISDPKGTIRLHTHFKVRGLLSDQFKHTYVFDKKTQKGTYLGAFQRNEWNWNNCQSTRVVKNTLISVDITNGQNPIVLDELSFGKPNETVRGSLFDPERKVFYAITAVRRDPFYAISFADLKNLKVLSEIDGLSGDINLFRFIGDRKFLLAVGRDNSSECTGFDNDQRGWRSTNLAVSIIDVRDFSKARLVQRKCVAIKNAEWSSSEINWNLDQAHKMIGLYQEGNTTLLTVPVDYYTKSESTNRWWWWYERKSAIGVMKWDLTKYDDTKTEKEQRVMENISTVIHPKGSVRRTIITKINDKRTVLNLSNTHLSIVDFEDINQPTLLSTYEIAPYIKTVYRFGDYVVEQVNLGQSYQDYNQFRVKKIGSGDINEAPVISSLTVGRVQNVLRWNNLLVFFSYQYDAAKTARYGHPYYDSSKSVVRIYDYSDPTKPKARGNITLPISFAPYYYFYCGMFDMAYNFGYSYYGRTSWINTKDGIAILSRRNNDQYLSFINFQNADKPSYSENKLPHPRQYNNNTITGRAYYNLVQLDDARFYLTFNEFHKEYKKDNRTIRQFRYYAQPWALNGSSWKSDTPINLPGNLIRVFRTNKTIKFLTQDQQYVQRELKNANGVSYNRYQQLFRLFLLEEYGSGLAILRDIKTFPSWTLRNVIVDNGRIYLNAVRDWYWLENQGKSWYDQSDNLMIFDASKNRLNQLFSQPTRTNNMQLVGIRNNQLIIKLPGEGILLADVSNPSTPKGLHFERTLGWVTNIEFAGDKALIAAGHFGIYQLDLKTPTIPSQPL